MLQCVCSCILFCVVLFKQKTAYEWRISDWSSDVCSSDLPVVTAPAGWACGPADTATTTTVTCTIDTLAAGVTQSFSLAVTATAAQAGTTLGLAAAEIGRASCRERGGQAG